MAIRDFFSASRSRGSRLPYINNWLSVAVTAVIAVISVLAHNHGDVTFRSAIIDAVSFGLLTFAIDTAIVYPQIRRRYFAGTLPREPRISKILRRAPRNPVLFGLLGGALFIGVTVFFNWLFFRFYQLEKMTLPSFLFFRVLYAVFFSAWMTKIIILRYVQPGVFGKTVPQQGTEEVRSAVLSVSTLKEEFNSARLDFGLNMILGIILGGTRVGMDLGPAIPEAKYWLFIFPAKRSGLLFSVAVYTVIVFAMMMVPVAKSILSSCRDGTIPAAGKANAFFSRLPRNPWLYSLVWVLPLFGFAFLFIWGVMTVMRFEILNFFQYFFIRLACTKLATKLFVNLCVLRYIQPDIGSDPS